MRDIYLEKVNKLTMIWYLCAMVFIVIGLVSQMTMSDMPVLNSASTQEAYNISEKNVDMVKSYSASMDNILRDMEVLRSYTKLK